MTTIRCTNGSAHTHDSISDVKACYGQAPKPAAPSTPAPAAPVAAKPASEKQASFLSSLLEDRVVNAEWAAKYRLLLAGNALSSKQASDAIDTLLGCPKKAQQAQAKPAASTVVPEGMHKVGEEIFKVQKAVHGSGHLYAKRLVLGDGYGAKARFDYAPGALKVLSEATKMTLEEAKAFGALYGTCCVCGRTLTNEDSIDAGIGPVCGSKFA